MVRRLRHPLRAAAAVAAIAAALVAAPPALAANTRVAISNYQWSKPEINIDLGEHVTWYWTGPDTMHSVTGISANAIGIDSDPGATPRHPAGDDWQWTFEEPGTYEFRCKLHGVVRGTVNVSSTPSADTESEPDPIPPVNVDTKAPKMSDVELVKSRFGAEGTTLDVTLNEAATVDAEFWRRPNGSKGHLRYAGWQDWSGHIGYNHLEGFGLKGDHLRPRSGRYVAEIRATDSSHNRSKARLRFTIR